jgi:hypothetical protein
VPRIRSRVAPWIPLLTALTLALIYGPWAQDDNLRIAIDIAGDDGLPGAKPFAAWEATRSFVERLGESRGAYLDFLQADDRCTAALLAAFLAIALITWRRVPLGWQIALAAAAVAYAASDWTENSLVRSALRSAASDAAPYVAAGAATAAKWLFGTLSVVLALCQFLLYLGPWRPWMLALFYDTPYFLDRAVRRLEFRANQEFAAPAGGLQARAPWKLIAFWLFAASVVFVCYGPTLGGFCSVSPGGARIALGGAGLALSAGVLWFVLGNAKPWLEKRLPEYRFDADPDPARQAAPDPGKRRAITVAALVLTAGLFMLPVLFAIAASLVGAGKGVCEAEAFSAPSLWRLVLCIGAIGLFAFVWRSNPGPRRLLAWQAAILGATALIYWFLLATPEAVEASGTPYRHVFAVVAPVVALVLWLAPAIARRAIGRPLAALGGYFRGELREHELFKALPKAPRPSAASVAHALLYGISYRWLQLALIPSLVVLVAPADWLGWLTLLGLLVATGLSTWGNLAPRWRQMALLVERWFLRGTALFVSLFVVAIAVCRIFGVSYVTTLLDGAPFGVIFSGSVMCYVLAWLVEYWINRAAAAELLGVLGNPGPQAAMPYPYAHQPSLGVEQAGRYLMGHGLGRFLVLGRVAGQRSPAFETYGMPELFDELAGAGHREAAMAVSRQVHLYFYAVNALLVLTVAAFGLAYWYANHVAQQPPVVTVRASADTGLTDLADRLLAGRGDERPALVVVASGGGTRAAVFATYVLEGLHRVGVDGDIVLLSGVSGGGVALAYFALHYPELSAQGPAALPQWQRFKRAIEANYIDDVLKGGLEWRVLGAAPLTVLLNETFERRLFSGARRAPTFELAGTPALILNTTVTGHPDEESALLMMSLNRPLPPGDCRETARPYKLMNGGRLIFTNIAQVSAFPKREAPIADVRLPYVIVRDPGVRLAAAAALNANFPPVFPNARVEVKDQDPNTECPDRSYFVTDGGAEENLGLVSALFAVQSALAEIAGRCRAAPADPWCRRRLRPIHFVIAEASATGYDYEQDRGVSAGMEGAKDRMTGGLTNMLIDDTDRLHARASSRVEGGRAAQGLRLRFHFLAMPLVFRSRGGVGTHWTHADRFTFSDPRVRAPHLSWAAGTVDVRWSELTRMWTALHDPEARFCDDASYGGVNTDTVRRWICGWRFDGSRPRDLHVLEWRTLVTELKPPRGDDP